MTTIHILKHLDSETLHLPELRPLLGKTVEIIVIEKQATSRSSVDRYPLRGSILRNDEPFASVTDGDENARQ